MKMDLKNINSLLSKELPNLKSKFQVATLKIFGSYIRNEQNSKSDLDLLVTFTKSPDLFEFIELENYLSDLLNLKVDLVMRSSLKLHIGKQILAEARPVS